MDKEAPPFPKALRAALVQLEALCFSWVETPSARPFLFKSPSYHIWARVQKVEEWICFSD